VQLALHCAVVKIATRIEQALILGIDMASHSNRTLGDETLLPGTLATDIVEPAAFLPNEHVGNDLLELGVLFSLGARQKPRLTAIQYGTDVAAGI